MKIKLVFGLVQKEDVNVIMLIWFLLDYYIYYIVTYAGQIKILIELRFCLTMLQTEMLLEGQSNKEILKSKSALEYINKWDIAIFRGGEDGILHRTN